MHLLLARHGETLWNREGRYQGHTDIPLSEAGEAQARALGTRLEGLTIHRAVASPLSRARRTAELALGRHAVELRLDDGLREISHGEWEGRLAEDIEATHPELLRQWRAGPPPSMPAGPGAESMAQVLTRAWAALGRASDGLGADEVLLLVAHDAVNRAILCQALGLPLERLWRFRQAPATLNLLSGARPDALQVVRLNDAAHVAPLLGEAVHRAL